MQTNYKEWGKEQAQIIERGDFKNAVYFNYWKTELKRLSNKNDLMFLYGCLNDITNEAIKEEIEADILKLLVDGETLSESIKVYIVYCSMHGYESTSAETLNQFCAIVRK